jgi:putative ABC transport system permease protein
MLAVTFADLWFRARQFAIAVIGVGLVLALALALSGLADGFHYEVQETVDAVGATNWVMTTASLGRITAFSAMPELAAVAMAHEPGVHRASPLLVVPGQVAHISGQTGIQTVTLFGVQLGGLGDPTVISGHGLSGPDQVVVNSSLQVGLGGHVTLGDRSFTVVGTVVHRTLTGGAGVVYMELGSAQRAAIGGQHLITAIPLIGNPHRVPAGLEVLSTSRVITGTAGQLGGAVASIKNTRTLMWIVAAAIVASMLYVAALERARDFAVLKALGSSTRALFGSLVLQSVVVTLLATVLAEAGATFLEPIFSQPVDLTTDARVALPFVAVAVGVLASVTAVRRVTGADPATAFG